MSSCCGTVLRRCRSQEGFTFVTVLVVMVIMGIMLGAAGQTWKTIMKRERETELLFRGMQYRNAIERWWTTQQVGHPPSPLNDLKALVTDPRSLSKTRYLRRLYKDPITGQDFDIKRDAVRGIIGVMSTSTDTPMKQSNFPPELSQLEGKTAYKEWEFTYTTTTTGTPQAQGSQQSGATQQSAGSPPSPPVEVGIIPRP